MRLLCLPALLAVGLFLLSGCSNNPYPPGESAGSVLYTALADDPKTLDPATSYDAGDALVVDLIYPSYFRYHYLKRDPFVMELNLGAEQPKREPYAYTTQEKGQTVQKHGEAWTFRIKPGLHFQDDPCFPGGKGREITAADFLYTFRRMADPAVSFPLLDAIQDKIIGMADYVDYSAKRSKQGQGMDYRKPVAGLQLDPKDPYTFHILLNQPYPQLRFLMAMHFTTPMPHEAVEKYGPELARHCVGCGPYVMTEYAPKRRIVLDVNPNRPAEYYPTQGAPGDAEAGLLRDAGKQLPLANRIVFSIIREGVTAWNLFLQGYLDTAAVTQTNFQQVMSRAGQLSPEMERKGIKLHRVVATDIFYFGFNMEDSTFGGYTPQRRKLRQALSLAVDSQAYIDLFSQGLGQSAQFLIPPGLFGYEASYQNPYRQYNLAHAKQLLAEAGYPGGIDRKTGDRLTLYFDNYFTTAAGRQLFGLFAKQMDAIGVHVESRVYRYNIYQDKLNQGQFQFTYYGWLPDYPDPENFLFLLYGPNKGPGPNYARYDNPEYNRLFAQMRVLDDGPKRMDVIRQMRAIAVEDCPWIFQQHDENYAIGHAWLYNVKPQPIANDWLKYRRVDGALRERLQMAWNHPNYWPALGTVLFLIVGSMPAASVVRNRRRSSVRRNLEGTR